MASLPTNSIGGLASGVSGLVATVTNEVSSGSGLLMAGEPVVVAMVTALVDGVLKVIPVVGAPADAAAESVISDLTVIISGSTVLESVVGSVTALVGTVTEVLPVIVASATGVVGSEINSLLDHTTLLGTVVGSAPTGLPTGSVPTSLPTGSVPTGVPTNSVSVTAPIGTNNITLSTTSTMALSMYSNGVVARQAPNSQLTSLVVLCCTVLMCMFGSGFLFMIV